MGAYLTSWFLVDVLCVVPLDVIVGAVLGSAVPEVAAVKLIRLLRLLRLLKLLRLVKLSRAKKLVAGTNQAVLQLMYLLFALVLIGHVLACFWHFQTLVPIFGGDGDDDGGATWLLSIDEWPDRNLTSPAEARLPGRGSYTDESSPNYVPSSSRYIAALFFTVYTGALPPRLARRHYTASAPPRCVRHHAILLSCCACACHRSVEHRVRHHPPSQ